MDKLQAPAFPDHLSPLERPRKSHLDLWAFQAINVKSTERQCRRFRRFFSARWGEIFCRSEPSGASWLQFGVNSASGSLWRLPSCKQHVDECVYGVVSGSMLGNGIFWNWWHKHLLHQSLCVPRDEMIWSSSFTAGRKYSVWGRSADICATSCRWKEAWGVQVREVIKKITGSSQLQEKPSCHWNLISLLFSVVSCAPLDLFQMFPVVTCESSSELKCHIHISCNNSYTKLAKLHFYFSLMSSNYFPFLLYFKSLFSYLVN